MPRYVVEAWWTVIRHAKKTVEAESLDHARDLACDDIEQDADWIGQNEECEDSDGPINLMIWDETGDTVLYPRRARRGR